MNQKLTFFTNKSSINHSLSINHPESHERIIAIEHRIGSSLAAGHYQLATASFFSASFHLPLIASVHTAEHIENVCSIPGTGEAACEAVGAVIAAIDAVCTNMSKNAFCAVRPPGHHAHNNAHRDGKNSGEGFCFFNNVAIAARYAQERYSTNNILIVDWDFHHGNGTESFFYDDPSVFYFSTHRLYGYPGTGYASSTGTGKGKGYTFNYPLPSPSSPYGLVSDNHFLSALSLLAPRLSELSFSPDLILISAGFDGLHDDPLGDFSLSEAVFYKATQYIMEIADSSSCNGRIVSVLEGGYAVESTAIAVDIHMQALAPYRSNIPVNKEN